MGEYDISAWYALYTKPRHEKLVERELMKKGVDAFTPKLSLKKRWSDRSKIIEEPVFKSYCFARFCLQDKSQIVGQEGVVTVVHFNKRYIEIQDSVINSIKIMVENDLKIDPYPYLKIGDPVLIKRGPLKGFEGCIIEKRSKNTSLVVSIDAIASSVKCIVDTDFVELN
ncbi:UpxY family transcription antiterminator [Candidatus Omnitrophota bacterium]